MDSRWLWGIVLIIIVAAGAWYLFSNPATTSAPGETAAPGIVPGEAAMPAQVTVTYTDEGFSPATVTIAAGQPVTWVNESSREMWVASAMHPDHLAYDGTSKDAHCAAGYAGPVPFDECAAVPAGGSYTFTFTTTGSWKYHNHVNAGDFGTIVVTAVPEAAGKGGDMTASTSVNVELR